MDQQASMAEQLARLEKLGGPTFVRKMIGLFLEIVPQRLQAIEQGLARGDLAAVEQAAHALKSSAGNLGCAEAQELCERIEGLAAAGQGVTLPELFAPLRQSLNAAVAVLSPMRDATS